MQTEHGAEQWRVRGSLRCNWPQRSEPDHLTATLATTRLRGEHPAMLGRLSIIAILALGLCGCGESSSKGAAESATRLLTAAFAGDRAAFEREIDRAAVRDDLRRQMTELAKATALDVEGGPSDFALDRMIGPDALTLVRAGTGEALTAAPTATQVAALVKVVDDKHACLRDAEAPGRCLLTFSKDRNGWRLVGMRAMNLRIEVADAGG